MSFKRPFRAEPVKLGPYWRDEQRRDRRKHIRRQVTLIALLAIGIFVFGMIVTNWNVVKAKLPTYYQSCAWARMAGAAPISRGSPGYRSQLDADGDGIACEPYQD